MNAFLAAAATAEKADANHESWLSSSEMLKMRRRMVRHGGCGR